MVSVTEQTETGRPCVIFDVDGTLAEFNAEKLGHLVHGEVKQWQAFHDAMADAEPIAPVAQLLARLKTAGEPIVICSGRPAGWGAATRAWLVKNGIAFDDIYLRPGDEDHLEDPEVKRRLLARMRSAGWAPWLVVDDRSSVVRAWRDLGLTCLQCAEGDF